MRHKDVSECSLHFSWYNLNRRKLWGECQDPLFLICPPALKLIFGFFLPRAFTTTKIFVARSCRLWLGLLPGLYVHATHSAAVYAARRLSLPFSIIHASMSPESRRTELCRCPCRTAGVFLTQERSQQELHTAMKRCFAVVNSSVSEGMSAAVLEVNIIRTHG